MLMLITGNHCYRRSEKNRSSTAKLLLNMGANINIQDDDALLIFVRNDRPDIVKLLIDN